MRLLSLLSLTASLLHGGECGVWRPLFDGRSNSGWIEITGGEFPAGAWTIQDASLKSLPNENGVQDIRSAGVFGPSFELEWEWRVSPGANSGLKYFIRRVDRWQSRNGKGYQARGRGSEYQIADDEGDRDAAGDPARSAASLYGRLAPAGKVLRPVGEFNHSRVVARGGVVEHWLNGIKVLSYSEPEPVKTPIVLQNHNSTVWFRGIRIREICSPAN